RPAARTSGWGACRAPHPAACDAQSYRAASDQDLPSPSGPYAAVWRPASLAAHQETHTRMYLSENESAARRREAENARQNRFEILTALSHGQISRRDLVKLGLFTAAGTIILKNGLSPFARSAFAAVNIPTGLPASPLFGVQPFTQPML